MRRIVPTVSKVVLSVAFILAICGADAVTAQMAQMAQTNGNHRDRVASAARVPDLVRDPADVPPSVGGRAAQTVQVTLVAKEAVGNLDPAAGTTYRYWTFNGKVPGPMIRVRQGDTVVVTLHNDASSHMVHSLDFHAAIGPGGGAALSQTLPGQTKTFTFQATTPGLFVYHCGTPMIADHIANGMYGLILVEPPGGLTRVDHEYYIMQGEIYTAAPKGKSGLQTFSEAKLMSESPEYFVFNGAVDAISNKYPLHASVGETVRLFFGNAGPNATSSMHVVGEIFTRDYDLGSLVSPPRDAVSTVGVPPGAAAILELKTDMPGQFAFMDHAISRMEKGLVGVLDVKGDDVARLMYSGGVTAAGASPAPAITKEDAEAAEAMLSSNSRSEPLSLPESDVHRTDSGIERQRRAAAPHASASPAATSTGLNGCLTLDGQMPKLTLFHSDKSYRLQAKPMLLNERPLLFAKNINSLVHVTGRMTGMADIYDSDHAQVFEMTAMDQLAPTCNVKESLAELYRNQQKRAQSPEQVAIAGAVRTNQIQMTPMTFDPPNIEVRVGERVVWKNTSTAVHNVVDDAAKALNKVDVALPASAQPFDSGYLEPGQSYARVFTRPGIYKYVCTLHELNGMKGLVVVHGPGSLQTSLAHAPSTATVLEK